MECRGCCSLVKPPAEVLDETHFLGTCIWVFHYERCVIPLYMLYWQLLQTHTPVLPIGWDSGWWHLFNPWGTPATSSPPLPTFFLPLSPHYLGPCSSCFPSAGPSLALAGASVWRGDRVQEVRDEGKAICRQGSTYLPWCFFSNFISQKVRLPGF